MKGSGIVIYSEIVPVSNEISRIIQAFVPLVMPHPTNHTAEILTKEPRVHQPSIQQPRWIIIGDQRNSRGYICHVYLNIGRHRIVHRCTLKCIPGKWLNFQRSKPFSSKQELPWCGWGVSVCFIQAQTIIDCGNKSMLTWWMRVLPEEALKWRNFGVLSILKVRKCYWKVRNNH